MTQQIKPNQVVQQPEKKINPYSAQPRDLDILLSTQPTSQLIANTSGAQSSGSVDLGINDPSNSSASTGDLVLAPPAVPAILSVVSQSVVYGPDGKATIDVIIEVQDVVGSAEYDVRVAKSAGTL